jgi:hypothetical protein
MILEESVHEEKKLNIQSHEQHAICKLPCMGDTQPANKIFLLGQEFCPVFTDEGDTIVSDPIELNNFKCQNKVDFSSKALVYFEYTGDPTNLDSQMLPLLLIPNNDECSLLWNDLSRQQNTESINGSFLHWPKESADLFLDSIATIFMRKMEQTQLQFFREDVNCFLELVQNLDWGKNEKTLPEKPFHVLTEHAFSSTRNPFFKSPLRYRYSDKFVGTNAKELASFCLAAGRLPNEKEVRKLSTSRDKNRTNNLVERV